MSHTPLRSSQDGDGGQFGHVTARMETTPGFGMPSISVSQQQVPKKFAPVVAPKPKFNPYKQLSESIDLNPPPPPNLFFSFRPGDYPLPLPPMEDFPLPPPPADGASFSVQVKGPEKTLEERRSSLDAEIDSLTSILADLENSPPYKPRPPQNYGTGPTSAPVIGHKSMVIPNQPPLTATKKSTAKPQTPTASPSTTAKPQAQPQAQPQPQVQPQPQPVPASYTTTSTPSRPAINVQVKTAQPSPHYMPPGPPQPPHHADFAYGPPQPSYTPQPLRGYPEQHYPGMGQGLAYGNQNTWRPEPAHPAALFSQGCHPPGPKKTYITDVPPALAPSTGPQFGSGPVGPAPMTSRPEEELDRLTKRMLYDMEHPPSEEYFGRCASCGENVVGEGTGCTAMDQVFHVDCFVCMTCGTKLRGRPFYAMEKKAYCEPCYINTLETCHVCAQPIMERILRATGKAYHPHCFSCVMCHRSLDGIPFTVDASNQIHCIEDFHKKYAPRCSVCKEPIMPAPGQEETVRIVALDRDFHVQCYRCEDCGSLLSEGDNQGCYPLDGHVLCKNCNTTRIQALTAKATTDL
uniref:LIM domain containing preferred translocation partner in lipoma n=1 Tax=Paramormyrops kingsleyae TaxID=1676925 RepID=A0A3B3RXU2_9TELE